VWCALADMGVVGLLAPAEHGGADAGMVDAAVVLEELGRALSSVPYASSAIGAVPLVGACHSSEARARLLPMLADGTMIGTLACYEAARRYRWDGGDAQLLLVVAGAPDGLGVWAVELPSPAVRVETVPTVDGSRREATVHFSAAPASRLGGATVEQVAGIVDRLAVAWAVDAVGAAGRALELAVEYAMQRVQFDKPIGSFQAVQHLCADMLRIVELGRAAAYYACWAIDEASPAEAHRAATMVQAYVSDGFAQLGGMAIQVFGGIGFTWEHDIHLFYKRLLSASTAFGTADEYLEELAAIVLSGSPSRSASIDRSAQRPAAAWSKANP
jgi:alkylation response protein AidB-like acyl-CoA dehydrogenase